MTLLGVFLLSAPARGYAMLAEMRGNYKHAPWWCMVPTL